MAKLTRRELIKFGASAAMGGAVHLNPGCESFTPPLTPTDKTARVAAIRGTDLYAMTRDALAAFGGAEAIVNPGETVFIKPNYGAVDMIDLDTIATGSCTKPEIVVAVAEACLKAGAAKIIIGDGAQVPVFSWESLKTLDGSTDLAAEAARLNATYPGGVVLACLNSDTPEWDAVPSPNTGLGEIKVSSFVSRADRIISIPVLKTHMMTQITASMKNFVGVAPTREYGYGTPSRIKLHNAKGGIERCFLDIVDGLKPDFTVIDGSICGEGNGPDIVPGIIGATVDMRDRLGDWLVLASNDLVAADATAARIMSHSAEDIRHIVDAYNRGMGQMKEDRIELVGATLEELRVPWQPAGDFRAISYLVMQSVGLLFGR